jgi:hypothetical protein
LVLGSAEAEDATVRARAATGAAQIARAMTHHANTLVRATSILRFASRRRILAAASAVSLT